MDSHKSPNSVTEDTKCSEASLLAEQVQIKKLFPELAEVDGNAAIEKYVWDHRNDIEKSYPRILNYFTTCATNIDLYKDIKTPIKEWIMKLWLVILQYSISSGNESNSNNTLTYFLFQAASKDSLLGLKETIRQSIIATIQEEVLKEHTANELVYQLYLILDLLALAAEHNKDTIEIQLILYFFVSQLQQSNKLIFDIKLKDRNNVCTVMPKKGLSFNLRYVVLYYINKLLSKNLIDPVKILLVLKKVLKYKKNVSMIMKAVRKVVLAFEDLRDIPLLEIVEMGFSLCSQEEYAVLIKELFKLISVVSVPELKFQLLEVLPKLSWTFTEMHQKVLSQSMKVILSTLEDFRQFTSNIGRKYKAIVIYLELFNKVQYNNKETKEELMQYSTALRKILRNIISKVVFIYKYRIQ